MEESDEKLVESAKVEAQKASDGPTLQKAKALFLGKRGPLASEFAKIKDLPVFAKKAYGQRMNVLKDAISQVFDQRQKELDEEDLSRRLVKEKVDITLPAHGPIRGTPHPFYKIIDLLTRFFVGYGYTVKDGPEVESDYFNFECLNIPKDHPARDMQDSFFIGDGLLLRSHTSPVQARTMQDKNEKPPFKIICPGKVYRRDNDATHSHQFGQIEGLVVGKDVTLANLTKTLTDMFKYLFGPKAQVRFRPSFFPFTEPSIECDVSWDEGNGKPREWLEVLGAGMVNPNVFRLNGLDPDQWQGFAFGIGIERMAMLLYGIDDIHRFYQDDVPFLKQFSKE